MGFLPHTGPEQFATLVPSSFDIVQPNEALSGADPSLPIKNSPDCSNCAISWSGMSTVSPTNSCLSYGSRALKYCL